MKKILLCLISTFCIAVFPGCENSSVNNPQTSEVTAEQSINDKTGIDKQTQSSNTIFNLKTASLLLNDEWDVIDLSNGNDAGDFDDLSHGFNYVINISDSFFIAVEEYTIYGDNNSSDDVLLKEYVRRNDPNTISSGFEEIGNKNCAALVYNDGKNGYSSEIVYLFVENGVHY